MSQASSTNSDMSQASSTKSIYLLDYGAGNVRSVVNAVESQGFSLKVITEPSDFDRASKILFPGVGAFGPAMERLVSLGFKEPLQEYIKSNRPFMGICVGMQALYETSEENPEAKGLGIIPASVKRFSSSAKSVPHIGWNGASSPCPLLAGNENGIVDSNEKFYFVHSFAVTVTKEETKSEHIQKWCHTLTTYGDESFVSSIAKGNVFATQFHPEKSGKAGLNVLKKFLETDPIPLSIPASLTITFPPDLLTRRVIACLDVRSNDQGDLVVTKGDQYDVREAGDGQIRNLGKPVELAKRYYQEGADEVTFLNITSFRDCPLQDVPMLKVLKLASESVFVPLTVGGGIRDVVQPDGSVIKAMDVAGEYFRSGADKVSIGSDAVYISEDYIKGIRDPNNAISTISKRYGAQAVVISVDPKRVYVSDPSTTSHTTIKTTKVGPNGEEYCWYQCTVKGGREARDLDVVQLTTSCAALGAGEILLNCMDHDGMNQGFDIELVSLVKSKIAIPVIASSGAGKPDHFTDVFAKTNCEAALAAGIFHRNQVSITQVKEHLRNHDYKVRL